MKLAELKETIAIPEGITVNVNKNEVTAKGKYGEIKRSWNEPRITVKIDEGKVSLLSKNASKKQKRALMTMRAHIKNMINGVMNNNEYKLKMCASHFPMQVTMEGNAIVVKNFIGEKIPRKIELSKDVQVKVQGDKIIVTGPDIEKVGETAARIETICRITNRDRRVFQDGIYIIEKNGKVI